jgi:hypothetical protein
MMAMKHKERKYPLLAIINLNLLMLTQYLEKKVLDLKTRVLYNVAGW